MPDPTPPADERVGRVLSSRFRVLRLVASGGMASVYEAEDLAGGGTGALKLLRAHCRRQPDAVERLSREAAAATRISDPHIVRTLDAGKLSDGEPFVFMELLNGQSLERLLSQRGRLPIAEAVDIAAQAARGLRAAHTAGVLHRDIKPPNLFITAGESGRGRRVKLLDFGVSKLSDLVSLTREGFALGTFSYMPPEQMMSAKRVDARADLYALGVVLYQCVTGRLPFMARSLHALMRAMEVEEYTRVSRLRPDAPPELDALIERSLRADPRARYAEAAELEADLERLCRRATPLPMLVVGPAEPTPRAPTPAPHTTPAPHPVPMRPVAPVAGTAHTGSLLVETIVPKTHRPE